MIDPVGHARPTFAGLTRRTFLSAGFLGLAGLALGADDPPDYYGKEADAKAALEGMLKQAGDKLDPQKNDLPDKWPANTVVYPSNIQERVSVMEEDGPGAITKRFVERLKNPDVASLYDAFKPFGKGVVAKSFGQYFPLAPVIPSEAAGKSGWLKSQNGKKDRYVLLISGEGNTSPDIRKLLKDKAAKHPYAAHRTDERFAQFLLEQENTNLILQYRLKLIEEQRFHRSLNDMREALTQAFSLPNNAKRVLVKTNPDDNKLVKTTKDTRMVVLHSPSAAQVEHVLKTWLGPAQRSNAELLVFFNGHGEVLKKHPTIRSQGADTGQIYLRGPQPHEDEAVPETTWKKWFGDHTAKFDQVAFMLDCCHAATFFAKKPPDRVPTYMRPLLA